MVNLCVQRNNITSTMAIKRDMYWWNRQKKGTKCTVSLHCFNQQGKIQTTTFHPNKAKSEDWVRLQGSNYSLAANRELQFADS